MRDKHFIYVFRRRTRVPRLVQRVWERYAGRVFGGSATETVFAEPRPLIAALAEASALEWQFGGEFNIQGEVEAPPAEDS